VKLDRAEFIYAIVFAFLLVTLGCRTTRISSLTPSDTFPRVVLRVATSGDYSPFSDWPVDAPAPLGFSVSVAQAYAHGSDAELRWIRFRWHELAADLAVGSFDLALSGITVRPDRSMQGRFSLPLTTSGAIVLVADRSAIESALDLDRPSIRIAVNAGGHLENVARSLFPSARIDAISDNARVLSRLVGGAVDAVVTDTHEAPHWRRNARIKLRTIGPLTRDLKAAWFPPENESEALRFNRWLLRAESTGQLDRLRQEHGLPLGRTARTLPALLSSLDERLTLMPAVADAKHILGAPIENPTREEVVLDAAIRAVQDAAHDAQISPPDRIAVRRLFRAQIDAAKWIQKQHLRNNPTELEEASPAGRLAAQTKLDEVIRPALMYLGERISILVIAWLAESPKDFAYDDVARALERHDLPDSNLRALYEALSGIVMRGRSSEPAHRSSPARTSRVPSESMRTRRP
jgi:cyclohexadienyl dehydratase